MKEKNEKRKKPQNDLNIKVFQGFFPLCFTRKIYKTIKVINTRKYASLEEGRFFTGGRLFTGGINQELINWL